MSNQRQMLQFADDQLSVTYQLQYYTEQLERLKKTNIINATFHIWHNGYFGTINGLRLGRLQSVPVEWSEINAAWGQTIFLLNTLARMSGVTFERYRLVPYGNQSIIEVLDGKKKEAKFDSAMVAFLDCLQQFKAHVETSSKGEFALPYKIEKDRIGDDNGYFSIKMNLNSMENWTKALKYTLTDLRSLNLSSLSIATSSIFSRPGVVVAMNLDLSLYELHRKPHETIMDSTTIAVSPRALHSELMCPICLDLMKNTQTTKECLHRFCQDLYYHGTKKRECPTCRKKLVSKRSLRADPNFDRLIEKIYPNRNELNSQQRKATDSPVSADDDHAPEPKRSAPLDPQLHGTRHWWVGFLVGDSASSATPVPTPPPASSQESKDHTQSESFGEVPDVVSNYRKMIDQVFAFWNQPEADM
eukprot:Em0017g41a